jgi:hypothetical protein
MKSTLIRILVGGALAASAITLLTTGSAKAADGKTLFGSMCDPMMGAETVEGQKFFHDFTGIRNYATAAHLVMCPLVRDNNGNVDGLSSLKVRTQVNGVAIACSAAEISDTGSRLKTVTKSSAAVTGPSLIDFGNTLNHSTAGGGYAIQCNLPFNAAVTLITYDEP